MRDSMEDEMTNDRDFDPDEDLDEDTLDALAKEGEEVDVYFGAAPAGNSVGDVLWTATSGTAPPSTTPASMYFAPPIADPRANSSLVPQ